MLTLLFDCNYLCHAAKYAMSNSRLLAPSGDYVHIVYNVLVRIRYLAEYFSTSNLAFFWDSKKNHRKKLYPKYKEKPERVLTKEDLLDYAQFDAIREWALPHIGFKNIFQEEGFEADDLLATTVRNPENIDYRKFIIISADHDLYQLLRPNIVSLYNPEQKIMTTTKSFRNMYNIEPRDWPLVKAYAGCTSDKVEGLGGVGEKTVCDFLNGKLVKGKRFDAFIRPEAKEILERNLPLVKLPFKGTPKIKLKFKKEKRSMLNFIDICEKMGFMSFKKNIPEVLRWKKALKLED